MKTFAPNITDAYKLGHPDQYAEGTQYVSSNFTPRDFSYASTTPATKTDKMIFVGLQYAVKAKLIDDWNDSFFNQPKDKVITRYARRLKNCLGTGQGQNAIDMMSDLHDLGYLPIKIKALPEGTRVNAGIPVFTVTNTHERFAPLVNYLETVLSNTVWPMCNSASLMEQYYLLAKKFGKATGASEQFWLPFAIHNFALRGHRGTEDGVMSAFGHSLFHKGTDTFAVIDFVEDYYNGNSDKELIGCSVNASEHATVCQQIAVHDGDEQKALEYLLTEVYPTGVFSYVSDSKDYWNVIENISLALKPLIVSRGANADGQPGVLTFRPDSSPDTPYEILLGYKIMDVESLAHLNDTDTAFDFDIGDYQAVKVDGKYYRAEADSEFVDYGYGDTSVKYKIELGRELGEAEAKGTLRVLWENFGGELVKGDKEYIHGTELERKYKLLDSHVRVIYGEAISLEMAAKIYQGMQDAGWCVGNVLFGVGSWAFIGGSSRDSYGLAMKVTNSIVDGVEYAMQKEPRGTSTFKKSAKGRLRVEKEGHLFILYDEQTVEQEAQGELKDFFIDGKIVNEQVFGTMVEMLK
jgi:nicotinamide phosphoribosyltransferase